MYITVQKFGFSARLPFFF